MRAIAAAQLEAVSVFALRVFCGFALVGVLLISPFFAGKS